MVNEQYINCPICNSQIPFDPYALIRGATFSCPKCPSVSIGIDQGSRDVVKNALDELDALKKNIGKTRNQNSSS